MPTPEQDVKSRFLTRSFSRFTQGRALSVTVRYAKRLGAHDSLTFALTLFVVVGLSFWAWEPLVTPGIIITKDGQQALWLYEVDRCFQDGQLPCRWLPDMAYGYGQPLFNYLAPVPYYIGEVVHLLGFSILDSLKAVFILGFLLSAGLMVLFARELWGNLGSAVAAVFYVYAPYHALDVYHRGDLGEHFAIALFPGILWAIYRVVKDGRPYQVLLLALFSSLLLLSHTLMTMIFFPVAALWAVVVVWQTGRLDRAYLLALAELWALGLAAFFVLPVLFERNLAHIDEAATGYFDFRQHFAFWDQLFLSRFWGFGLSVGGPNDGMSFQIGWLHWGLAGISIFAAPFIWRAHRLAFVALILFFLLFWAGVLMTHEWSKFIWEKVPDLKWVQFPWRFLALIILMSSLLAGSLFSLSKARLWLSLLLFGVLVGAVIGLNREFFVRVGGKLDISDAENFSGERFEQQTFNWGVYYLPIAVPAPPQEPDSFKVQVLYGQATVSRIGQGSDFLTFGSTSNSVAKMRVAIFDFPNWRVRVDGRVVPHGHDGTGAITFDLPSGRHQIALNLEDTAIRKIANYLSLLSWALFAVAAFALLAKKTRRALKGELGIRYQ